MTHGFMEKSVMGDCKRFFFFQFGFESMFNSVSHGVIVTESFEMCVCCVRGILGCSLPILWELFIVK